MLKRIESLKAFGIFDDYTRPADTKDFCDRNVIYGWNYSGKTTLSRLFHALNERKLPDTLDGAQFSVVDAADVCTDQANLASCTQTFRVFNSDFVEASLNWSGRVFNPILLLGEEAKEAQAKIDHYEQVIKRCSGRATIYRLHMSGVDDRFSEHKTVVAKEIKATLGIVEAFNAIHLMHLVNGLGETNHLLDQPQLQSDLSLATASDKDRLPSVNKFVFNAEAATIHMGMSTLLAELPASSKVIELLKDQPDIAEWVDTGLRLHDHTETCHFCTNTLSAERRSELQAHFSREMTEQRGKLAMLLDSITKANFKAPDIRESDLNAQFRPKLGPMLERLGQQAVPYDSWIRTAESAVRKKLKDQFSLVQLPEDPRSIIDAIAATLAELNTLVADSNAISEGFTKAKVAAIRRLKHHYAQRFKIDFKVAEADAEKRELEKRAQLYETALAAATRKMKEQEARINKAQKGREKINERIAELLTTRSIQIDVRPEGGVDRFVLMRGKRVARNLSEGEKTAIAFAFFLTKLLEDDDLSNVVVYIDDPISSLDSNHIFQVFSILRATFFEWVKPPNDKGEWKTKCKQLFVSTHNFEFFQLLHDLPGGRHPTCYYLTKRIDLTRATFVNLPSSVTKYTSEYHYLFHLLYSFHTSENKTETEHLLALPNAARRFVELYTYAKLPLGRGVKVDKRAERLFGVEKSVRILKALHHFSHLESIERLAANTDVVADIDGAITALMEHLETDKEHYDALVEAVTRKD